MKGCKKRDRVTFLCEGGKAKLGVSDVEYSIVVGDECLAQDPHRVRVRDNAANGVVKAGADRTNIQALRGGEVLATDSEGHGRRVKSQGKCRILG
jgi:hypothetical protein